MRVEVREPVDHRLRLLGGRRIVEPDQRPAVDPLGEHGEVPADRFHAEPGWVLGGLSGGLTLAQARLRPLVHEVKRRLTC